MANNKEHTSGRIKEASDSIGFTLWDAGQKKRGGRDEDN